MYYAKVIGTVWSTQKDPSITAKKMQIIQPFNFKGEKTASPLVAIDTIGSGIGETVLYVTSSEAVIPMNVPMAPVDASIVGIVSRVDLTD